MLAITLAQLEFGMRFYNDELDMCAYVNKDSGTLYFHDGQQSTDKRETSPEDLYDNPAWIAIPSQQGLDLGKALFIEFIVEYCPEKSDLLFQRLRKHGGYRAVKDDFERQGLLEQFYQFEDNMTQQALRHWAEDEGLLLEDLLKFKPEGI